jgi:chaperonin GroES
VNILYDEMRGGAKEEADLEARFQRIRPMNYRVIVKMDEKHDLRTRSGILLAHSEKELPQEGVVVFADKRCKVGPGDEVVYSKYAGAMVKVNNDTYLIIPEKDLLAYYARPGQRESSFDWEEIVSLTFAFALIVLLVFSLFLIFTMRGGMWMPTSS